LVGQSVYEQLRSDIVTGKLAPGEKLKLNALRLRYSASVNTLRETLMRLVSDGFVLFVDPKRLYSKNLFLPRICVNY